MRSAYPSVALVLVLAACDGSSGPSGALCTTPVEVSVSNGAATQIAWTPDCLVQQVLVFESIPPSLGGPRLHWGIRAGARGMASPLGYGQVPAVAQVTLAAKPLVEGRAYLVQVSMTEVVGSSTIIGEDGFIR